MNNILITICGRAGSKGVKNKNIRDFLGKPLVLYTIKHAKKFKAECNNYKIDIAVNSDSEELLKIAEKEVCYIVHRKNEDATDIAAKIPVIIDTTKEMEKKLNKKYEYVIDLDITSPLRKEQDIFNGLNLMRKKTYDCVFSVVLARRNPYFNMVEEKNGVIKKIIEANYLSRQQAPKVYDMNASIYIYRRSAFSKIIKDTPFDGKIGIFEMRDYGVIDIDSERDFELMKIIYEKVFVRDVNENI